MKLPPYPPFLFRQLKDVMQATKGWLAYQLQHTQPSQLSSLEDIYRRCAERSIDEIAAEIASKENIPEAKARSIVKDHLAQRRDLTTTDSLLDFLQKATELATQAGFKGLVLFADECQEFLRMEESGAREAIQIISELVKGIRAMATVPLGLMLTLPVSPTETVIEEQAGDIIHRMRERGTALRLEDTYGRDFPTALWRHLCTACDDVNAQQVIDEQTLDALGQLVERKDLSNGPRTTIAAFKRIVQFYQQQHRPYTPIDLIDDHLNENLVFDERGGKVATVVRRLLELPAVQQHPTRQRAVKLLAAFPHGVDEAKAGELFPIIVELADKERWLGEHITQLSEGYALVSLQERAEARPLLDEIIRDFRRQWHTNTFYRDDRRRSLLVATEFFEELLPMLFPPRSQGQYTNFGGHKKPDSDPEGVAYCVLEGSFDRLFHRFPDRRVCVAVSPNKEALNRFQPPEEELDIDFRFFLEFPDNEQLPIGIHTANQDRRVDFYLNLSRTFGRQFPPDLAFLHDLMSPERTSAQVLLALALRMRAWLQEHPDTSEADRQMIEAHRRLLHRYAMLLLFPDAADRSKVDIQGIQNVAGAEQRLIEAIFEAKCAELYPYYKPLMMSKEWRSYLLRYRDALGKRPLAERRGRQPFTGSKDEIAKTFGWTHTVFEASSRSLQSMGLLQVNWGSGRGAEGEASVLFKEHPLEKLLRDTMQAEGRSRSVTTGGHSKRVKSIEASRLKKVARRYGYLADEVDEAIELLILRQYVQRESDGTIHEFTGTVDTEELKGQAQTLQGQLKVIACYFDDVRSFEQLLHRSLQHLESPEDEIARDTAHRLLQELSIRLDQFLKGKAQEIANQLKGIAEELDRCHSALQPPELQEPVMGAVDFARHVDDQRKGLQKQFQQLLQKRDQLNYEVEELLRRVSSTSDADTLCKIAEDYQKLDRARTELIESQERLRPYLIGLQQWREIVTKATMLRDSLEPNHPLRQEIDERVSTSIMENFAHRRLDALLDWERFKADVDTIEDKLKAEENRKRNEFLELKEQYERMLAPLVPQRIIQAPFDPQEPQQSYLLLYQGVLRKLQEWLGEQQQLAQQTLDEWEYLICERGIPAEEERNQTEQVLRELQQAGEQLNQGHVENLERCQQFCKELDHLGERLNEVRQQLRMKRAQKGQPTEAEQSLLTILDTQRRSLGDLRRQLNAERLTLDKLFDQLKGLYRKGHIEIEVRKRE